VLPEGTTSTTLEQPTEETNARGTTAVATVATGESITSSLITNDLYAWIIKRHLDAANNNPNVNAYHYVLYDLDGNGTNELLLGFKEWGLVEVYSIQNGVAVRQEESSLLDPAEVSPPLLFKNGVIRVNWNTDGAPRIAYYRFEDGELKRSTTLIDNFGQYYRYNMYADQFPGASITKAEFNRLQKEFEGDGQVVELDWKPLAEYER